MQRWEYRYGTQCKIERKWGSDAQRWERELVRQKVVRLRLETKVLKFKHSYFSSHIHNEEVVLVAKSMKLIGTTYSFPRMNGTGNPHRPNCERERERERGLKLKQSLCLFCCLLCPGAILKSKECWADTTRLQLVCTKGAVCEVAVKVAAWLRLRRHFVKLTLFRGVSAWSSVYDQWSHRRLRICRGNQHNSHKKQISHTSKHRAGRHFNCHVTVRLQGTQLSEI